ncbi:GDSL-type esterase/lipase family protein [soil metagenome]
MKSHTFLLVALGLLVPLGLPSPATAAPDLPAPEEGERIVFVGGGMAERMLYFGFTEAELHLRFPEKELTVRNMARPGDTPGFRPHPARTSQWAFPGAEKFHPGLSMHLGEGFYPTPDEWLTMVEPDTIVAFFGFNESFDGPEGADNFKAELDAFVTHTLSQRYGGDSPPRLVLASPIAFEDLSATRALPDGTEQNKNLEIYAAAIEAVAEEHDLTFIDLFHPTLQLFAGSDSDMTINGISPNDKGFAAIATLVADGLYGEHPRTSKADPELVREAVVEKDWFWHADYQALNGVHVYGRRYEPYGPQNYPDEIEKLRQMTALRDTALHEVAQGEAQQVAVDDSKTNELPEVPTNFTQPVEYLGREKAIEKFTLREGFEIGLFASESEFPDLKNPVQLSFDNKGRLWVAVSPTYPHYRPGAERPDDKILIYEDTDGDGRADKQIVFADGLHLPIGFEIAPEGVYVSQEPNLCILIDDDGDDQADRMEILLHGFDSHDTHHAISAYAADASGAFYLSEGRFLHSQVETPYGPERVNDGGVWRFDPRTFKLTRYSQSDYNNPWGIAFDEWDQLYISDASGGNNWWGLPLSAKMPYGVEIDKTAEFAPKRARPTAGSEFVYSRHFPDELQGDFLLNNSIGFLGTSIHDVWEDESGFSGKHIGDLISSSDPNYRPVDQEFGPDGALYIVDWHNALVGHMQHNARDPNRDYDHGRIYRLTYPSRPLVEPAKIAGASIEELLENLKLPEYRTRYRTRRELRGRPADEVIPAVQNWVAGLDRSGPGFERYRCEALWATWAQGRPDAALLSEILTNSPAHQARAAAAHVLRYAHGDLSNSTDLFLQAARDRHGRVRLEAIVAASWLDDKEAAKAIVGEAVKLPLDKWMATVTKQIIEHQLGGAIDTASLTVIGGDLPQTDEAKAYGPTRELTDDEMKTYAAGKEIYLRDAHCATCHQPDGQGLEGIYPPVSETEWATGDPERLIKITLKGLWGPIEVKGTTYDPSQGVPPMTPFGGILDDGEIAAVLSYVRTSFGNDAPFVTAEEVARVREATKDRTNFYMVDEILSAHPLE